jgi:hypothetical protein
MKYYIFLLLSIITLSSLKTLVNPHLKVEASLIIGTQTVKLGNPSLQNLPNRDYLELDYTGMKPPNLFNHHYILKYFGTKSYMNLLHFPIIKMTKASYLDDRTMAIRFNSLHYLVLRFKGRSELKKMLFSFINDHLYTEHLDKLTSTKMNLKQLLKRFNDLNKYIKKYR